MEVAFRYVRSRYSINSVPATRKRYFWSEICWLVWEHQTTDVFSFLAIFVLCGWELMKKNLFLISFRRPRVSRQILLNTNSWNIEAAPMDCIFGSNFSSLPVGFLLSIHVMMSLFFQKIDRLFYYCVLLHCVQTSYVFPVGSVWRCVGYSGCCSSWKCRSSEQFDSPSALNIRFSSVTKENWIIFSFKDSILSRKWQSSPWHIIH